MTDRALLIASALVALGLTAAGALAGGGLREGRAKERWVTVKGLAERPVEADLASWPISYTLTGDELDVLHSTVSSSSSRSAAS